MEIKKLEKPTGIDKNDNLKNAYLKFEALLAELKKRKLTDNIITLINETIDILNSKIESRKDWRIILRKRQSKILRLMEKELKLVPKNYYRTLWISIGTAGIGLPIGSAIGLLLDNIGLMGVGLPIGMAIGVAIGTSMDKKALNEGRQLLVEIM